MHSRRIKVTSLFSALMFFRAWRKHLGARQAYWLTVSRFGWPEQIAYAWPRLGKLGRMICNQAA